MRGRIKFAADYLNLVLRQRNPLAWTRKKRWEHHIIQDSPSACDNDPNSNGSNSFDAGEGGFTCLDAGEGVPPPGLEFAVALESSPPGRRSETVTVSGMPKKPGRRSCSVQCLPGRPCER